MDQRLAFLAGQVYLIVYKEDVEMKNLSQTEVRRAIL